MSVLCNCIMLVVTLLVCILAVCESHQNQQQTDQGVPYASGNDYHCNPSFNIHSANGQTITGCNTKSSYQAIAQQPTRLPRDCSEVQDQGYMKSGQYIISPQDDGPSFPVYCDLETDGGGWLVFQRREDGLVDFYRTWAEYENGFGNTNSEHWLGNEKIHRITAQANYQLRIDMADFEGNSSYAKYGKFRIGGSSTKYKLVLGRYNGNAGDSLSGHNKKEFTTKDADHDTSTTSNCAVSYTGAWWYTSCHNSNLNGQYLEGPHESYADGVNWEAWKGYKYSLKFVEMKIRVI